MGRHLIQSSCQQCGILFEHRPDHARKYCGRKCSTQGNRKYNSSEWEDTEHDLYVFVSRYRQRAEKLNLRWELSYEDVKRLISNPCRYCGDTEHISIDRLDNEIGYTVDNTVSCCDLCNLFKSRFSASEFLYMVCRIYEHTFKSR